MSKFFFYLTKNKNFYYYLLKALLNMCKKLNNTAFLLFIIKQIFV